MAHTVWIKEAKVRQFGAVEEFALAYRYLGPATERTVHDSEPVPGKAVALIIGKLHTVLRELPQGASVVIVCDQQAVVGAWTHGWLRSWRAGGFQKRPRDPDAWRGLSNLINAHRLAVTARLGTLAQEDQHIMASLSDLLSGKRPPQPGEPEDYWQDARLEEKQADALWRRAIARD